MIGHLPGHLLELGKSFSFSNVGWIQIESFNGQFALLCSLERDTGSASLTRSQSIWSDAFRKSSKKVSRRFLSPRESSHPFFGNYPNKQLVFRAKTFAKAFDWQSSMAACLSSGPNCTKKREWRPHCPQAGN